MADDDTIDFLIFLLKMSIAFCIMYQYNIKFQVYCKYLSKLRKKSKIEKVTISWISTFHVYILFWNRVFQKWPMKPETRMKLQLQGVLTLLITRIEGARDWKHFSQPICPGSSQLPSQYIALLQYLLPTNTGLSQSHVPMLF